MVEAMMTAGDETSVAENTEMGLQFTPSKQIADQMTSQPESQEMMMNESGEAVLLGAGAGEGHDDFASGNRHAPCSSSSSAMTRGGSRKGGRCPTWLRDSSRRTKGILSLSLTFLLAFAAVTIVGVVQLPPSSSSSSSSAVDDGGGGGGGGAIGVVQSEVEDATTEEDPAVVVPSDAAPGPPATTREPSPAPTESPTTSPPTSRSVTVPLSGEEMQILLPESLEARVPDFSDGLNADEERNWNAIADALEGEIIALLGRVLPARGYSAGSARVESFDGFVTGSLRRKRGNDDNGETETETDGGIRVRRGLRAEEGATGASASATHAVVYSASVAVRCARADCSSASETVAGAATALREGGVLRISAASEDVPIVAMGAEDPGVEAGEEPPVAIDGVEDAVVPTPAPITASPTARGTTGVPTGGPSTSAPTPGPTAPPEEEPTPGPATQEPTSQEPTVFVPPALSPLSDRDCSTYTPCEPCYGSCDSDDECEEGLSCFQRRGYAFVPGCTGPGRPDQSYCYDPFAEGLEEVYLLSAHEWGCDKKYRCEKCRGDCDEDDDCEKGLYCYRRNEFELVPGCAGQGESGTDYCFDPADLGGIGDF